MDVAPLYMNSSTLINCEQGFLEINDTVHSSDNCVYLGVYFKERGI